MRVASYVVALALSASSAHAGGFSGGSIKDSEAPAHSWSGFYVGVTAGGGWGDTTFEETGFVANTFDIDGFVLGATAGYNYEITRNLLIGVEADISYSDIEGSFGPGNLGLPGGGIFTCPGPCVTEVEWFGTLRGRIGYTGGPLLVYGTGGLAFGDVDSSFVGAQDFGGTSVGWTAGGGIEYALTREWSAKVEYLHVDLGWTEKTYTPGNYFRSDNEFDVVRAGINYRFGQ